MQNVCAVTKGGTTLKETSFSKTTMVMRFPAKKNAGWPNAPRDFPPRKDGILYPPLGCLGTPLPLPQSLCGRTYGRSRDYYVTTKISRIDRLPNLLSNGAPLKKYSFLTTIFSCLFEQLDSFSFPMSRSHQKCYNSYWLW